MPYVLEKPVIGRCIDCGCPVPQKAGRGRMKLRCRECNAAHKRTYDRRFHRRRRRRLKAEREASA